MGETKKMNHSQEIIGGKLCHLFARGVGGPVIYWGISEGGGSMVQNTVRLLEKQVEKEFFLVAYESRDWNRDYSPWPQQGLREGEVFEGKAGGTLCWLKKMGIPLVENRLPVKPARRITAGYSLAGLFSLWAYLECDLFTGAVSVSGSLWYPGWLDLLKVQMCAGKEFPKGNHSRWKQENLVYLSLGKKEEKTRNPRMAEVGDATRETARMLREVLGSDDLILEWNSGGHFTDPEGRMARGLAWMLRHLA